MRLKAPTVAVSSQTRRFQFQTGAIKSSCIQSGTPRAPLFQFQTGAIKRITQDQMRSIGKLFQFQTGAIKRAGFE